MPSPSGDGLIRIASRGSQLALWQSNAVRSAIGRAEPEREVEIEIVRTTGDRILDVPLSRIGDRGLFTKEIDEALLERRADLAVHSLKDVPTRLPEGLVLAAVSERADPRDVLVARGGVPGSLATLPPGARVGTSSLRRRAQLRAARPDVEVLDIRGNLDTRLAKLDRGEYDAILLAAAGVIRLGWSDRISETLEPEHWLPAVGQGALAIIAREDDADLRATLASLHHFGTAAAVRAERALLRSLEGGCQIPIAALGTVEGDTLRLDALVADLEGETILRGQLDGPAAEAERIGTELAERLRADGADRILDEVRRLAAAPAVPAP